MDAFARPQNERIGALATLPVFFELRGKPVLVGGGSDGAAWKAELLAAAGAEVHVFCPVDELSNVFLNLLRLETPPSGLPAISPTRGENGWSAELPPACGAESWQGGCRLPISPLVGEMPGRAEGGNAGSSLSNPFIHHDTHWQAAYFKSFALAVGDCETGEEARLFHERAVAAGVPVNVIDKPEFCQFKFGSIVNRSPVVIGISTDGAAPILGQAIRRRIETLLPQSLKSWAELAHTMRERIGELLQPGHQRRNFWERFVDRAFSGAEPDGGTFHQLVADANRLRGNAGTAGRVTLVGAGPGDAEFLTLKAVRALQAADVILFDDLVAGEVLELARREAKRMLVGKRGGRESCRQEDINATMLAFAKAGKRVVRLKAGDPMVFGRAGEEIEFLEGEGIAVDVVPGITAASAMAARLGVSLTHRDHAQAVRFVTGHSRQGHLPTDMDWRSLADPRTTTIFYMGGRTADEIRSNLIVHGMTPDMPVVVMSAISRANERSWMGHLADLGSAVEAIGIDEPVLIGIGTVFARRAAQNSIEQPGVERSAVA